MNAHLDEAYEIAAQIDAILYAIDETFLDDADSRLQHLLSLLHDLTVRLVDELDLLAEDRKVVDAIYAVNAARRGTLTTDD